MRVGVSIVSMNRGEILRQTMEAARLLDPNFVVVDNASTHQETMDIVRQAPRFIIKRENWGLSHGVNSGLHIIDDCDVLMHLDDDALLVQSNPSGLGPLLSQAFENNPELGLIVPNLGNYSEYILHDDYRELRWALGFCWAIRRDCYSAIGGYDPQLLHQQECDFALRVRMAGYTVGTIPGFECIHNDPGPAAGTPRSDLSLAREHLGCVQFRDKWASYFRGCISPGVPWSYGTMPLYLMQHWPPDQEWYRRYAEANGIMLNPPPPDGVALPPGSRLGLVDADADKTVPRLIEIQGHQYLAYTDLRNDYGYWASGPGYLEDREKAIARWLELTGEKYDGYWWPRAVKSRLGE